MNRSTIQPDSVIAALPEGACRVRVAFSGGLDSSVLLHLLAGNWSVGRRRLEAMHVHHGLHPDANRWADHCRRVCAGLNVPFRLRHVQVVTAGDSPEASARDARYRALAGGLNAGDVVVTAHHADDQAETVLLRLLRGAGVHGLRAMVGSAPLAGAPGVRIVRPLLALDRARLAVYARDAGLQWVEDPANVAPDFDRSYLRQAIVPHLRARWPAMARTLSRSADLCADAVEILDGAARADLAVVSLDHNALSVSAMKRLPPARRRNVLRIWLQILELPPPSASHLHRLEATVLVAGADTMPCMTWSGVEVRRYRNAVYAMPPLPKPPGADLLLDWSGETPLILPPGCGRLVPANTGMAPRSLTVRFRQGGERMRPRAGGPSRPVRKLFQEAGMPPWVRQRAPFLYHDGVLVNVAGQWSDAAFEAGGEAVAWDHRLPGHDNGHSGRTG